ncbi:hypothetical protein [Sphingomonas alpina]|uniref:Uncharacterized protein n=1 Tax=Sphingomonas alpina TaxID=653931 RepID=A0A7H0LD77_9SPHN|nr:hypothetical protein [Sphingomonas alpina]QNQ07630.1 hypothetical protein H3Z74_12410 [Sphingomonas alpina]
MPVPDMRAEAILYRLDRVEIDGRTICRNTELARGPIMILARSLRFRSAAERGALWIKCAGERLGVEDVEALVQSWFASQRKSVVD